MTIQHSFVYKARFPDFKNMEIRRLKNSGLDEIRDKYLSKIPYEKKIVDGEEIYKMRFKIFTDKAWDEFLMGLMLSLEGPRYNNKRLFIKTLLEELENQPII